MLIFYIDNKLFKKTYATYSINQNKHIYNIYTLTIHIFLTRYKFIKRTYAGKVHLSSPYID